jgi:hypothetical protein
MGSPGPSSSPRSAYPLRGFFVQTHPEGLNGHEMEWMVLLGSSSGTGSARGRASCLNPRSRCYSPDGRACVQESGCRPVEEWGVFAQKKASMLHPMQSYRGRFPMRQPGEESGYGGEVWWACAVAQRDHDVGKLPPRASLKTLVHRYGLPKP